MKRFLVILAAVLAFSACSQTNSEEEKRIQVSELLILMDMKTVFKGMHQQIEKLIQHQLSRIQVAPEEQATVSKYYAKMTDVIRQEMTWDKMREQVIELYMQNFTADEVEGMLDFYSSEVGKAAIRKMPVVMQETTQLGRDMAQSYLPKVQELAQQLDAEIKANRKQATNTPAAKSPAQVEKPVAEQSAPIVRKLEPDNS